MQPMLHNRTTNMAERKTEENNNKERKKKERELLDMVRFKIFN